MTVALLKEPLLSPPADLGPYRREDYEALPEIHLDLAVFWKKVEEDLE